MAFIGTPLDTRNTFQSLVGKRFDGDGSTTDFTLDVAPGSVLDIEVFVGNVRQDPNSAYTLSGTTLSFTGAPPSGTNNIYVVHQAKSVGTIDVPALGVSTASIQADAITEAKIADDAVESEHLNNNIISGQTALGATPADTDEFLVSDAGTIKRVDYSYIKSVSGTESFLAILSSNQTVSDNASTLVAFDTESYDVGSNYTNTSSNYKYTVPTAGKYRFYSTVSGATDGSYAVNNTFIKLVKNGSSIFFNGSDTHQNSHAPDVASAMIDITVDCSANDYFQIYGQVNTTGSGISTQNFYSDSSRRTWFGGYRIA
jgi:hypothetical protein